MTKIIVSGYRHWNDYQKFSKHMFDYLYANKHMDFMIVHGGAPGVDALADRFSKKQEIPHACFPAKWKVFSRGAGPERNYEMARFGDELIAFVHPKSSGTLDMIEKAKKQGLKVTVINIK